MSDIRAINSIIVGERHRRDMGDIASLARSIAETRPPASDRRDSGRASLSPASAASRRAAARLDRGSGTVVDLAEIVRGELAENAERKDFLPSEIEINPPGDGLPTEKEAAKERMSKAGRWESFHSFGGRQDPRQDRRLRRNLRSHRWRRSRRSSRRQKPSRRSSASFRPTWIAPVASMAFTGGSSTCSRPRRSAPSRHRYPAVPSASIVADVPLPYEEDAEDPSGRGVHPYPTMSLADICALPIRALAADDAILWIWITNHHLLKGSHVPMLKAWGFEAMTILTWKKDQVRPRPLAARANRALHHGGAREAHDDVDQPVNVAGCADAGTLREARSFLRDGRELVSGSCLSRTLRPQSPAGLDGMGCRGAASARA